MVGASWDRKKLSRQSFCFKNKVTGHRIGTNYGIPHQDHILGHRTSEADHSESH